MAKLAKKSLKTQIEENTTVKRGTKDNQTVLKSGTPNDQSRKHELSPNTVGANIGITKNMDNYESLRVDCWGVEEVQDGETKEEAFQRLLGTLDKVLSDTVQSYMQ